MNVFDVYVYCILKPSYIQNELVSLAIFKHRSMKKQFELQVTNVSNDQLADFVISHKGSHDNNVSSPSSPSLQSVWKTPIASNTTNLEMINRTPKPNEAEEGMVFEYEGKQATNEGVEQSNGLEIIDVGVNIEDDEEVIGDDEIETAGNDDQKHVINNKVITPGHDKES